VEWWEAEKRHQNGNHNGTAMTRSQVVRGRDAVHVQRNARAILSEGRATAVALPYENVAYASPVWDFSCRGIVRHVAPAPVQHLNCCRLLLPLTHPTRPPSHPPARTHAGLDDGDRVAAIARAELSERHAADGSGQARQLHGQLHAQGDNCVVGDQAHPAHAALDWRSVGVETEEWRWSRERGARSAQGGRGWLGWGSRMVVARMPEGAVNPPQMIHKEPSRIAPSNGSQYMEEEP